MDGKNYLSWENVFLSWQVGSCHLFCMMVVYMEPGSDSHTVRTFPIGDSMANTGQAWSVRASVCLLS